MVSMIFKPHRLFIFLCATVMVLPLCGAQQAQQAADMQHNAQTTERIADPEDTGVVFDWNKVIGHKRYVSNIFPYINISNAGPMWAATPNKKEVSLYVIPMILYSLALHAQDIPANEIKNGLLHRFSCLKKIPNVEEHLLRIMNNDYIDPEVERIIREFKQKNFFLMLASNIDPESAAVVRAMHPDFFRLFDAVQTAYKDPHGNWVKKPNAQYYIKVAELVQSQKPSIKKLLFIDDKEKNTTGAERTNAVLEQQQLPTFTGIVFKNSSQLMADLKPYLENQKEAYAA